MNEPGQAGAADERARNDEYLLNRVNAVERQARGLRRWFRLTGLALVASLGLIAVLLFRPDLLPEALTGPPSGEVRTEALVLLDPEGLVRGRWAVDDEGNTRLTMLDERGRPRLRISVLEGGFPGMSFINGDGQSRAAIGLLPDETTSLVFADAQGVPRAVLGLTRDDGANLVFADAMGVSRVGLGVDGSGTGSAFLPEPESPPEEDPGEDGNESG